MSLVFDYCKEIARELQKNVVYTPGSEVKVGDILKFNAPDILGKPRALGEFTIVGNLENSGKVNELMSPAVTAQDINASVNLKVSKYNEASLFKDWSTNVPVFFELSRFKRKFQSAAIADKKISMLAARMDKSFEKINPYVLEEVEPSTFLS